MRFVLDQDVDARLVGVFVTAGHEAWTVYSAGIPDASDDDVSVYAAEKNAVVVTHDVEFSTRRRKNPHGRHVQLGCKEFDAPSLVAQHLDEVVALLEPFDDVFVYLSKGELARHTAWE